MSSNLVLVDPLAALFRPALAGQAPLTLTGTTVEVELVPPLANIAITRRFTNDGDLPIEAVLTLPPAAEHEVVYGLVVMLDGIEYRARAQPRRSAARTYDHALAQGRVAILHEHLHGEVQLVSIAPIRPGAEVLVRVESIRPVTYPTATAAALKIALIPDATRINRRLSDAEALLLTSQRHPATLTVAGEGLRVFLPQAGPLGDAAVSIDCAAPIALRVLAVGERSLECSEHEPTEPWGWRAALAYPAFGSPLHEQRLRIADSRRRFWSCSSLYGGVLEVLAPAPAATRTRLSSLQRAVTAMAMATSDINARNFDRKASRLAANLLDADTSLVFIGPQGEISENIPSLRKLALSEPLSDETALQQKLPGPSDYDAPGAKLTVRRSQGWIIWALGVFLALLIATAWKINHVPIVPLAISLVVLLLLAAYVSRPQTGDPVWRRLGWLLLMPAPWIAAMVFGPLGFVPTSDPLRQSRMLVIQDIALVFGVILPLALILAMKRARRFTAALGMLNLLISVAVDFVSSVVISPGS